MQISTAEVENIARLARLELTEAEKDAFGRQLSTILTYMEKLNTYNTEGVEPTATVLGEANVFREDIVRPSLPVDRALANAPEQADEFFLVPRIIEERKA